MAAFWIIVRIVVFVAIVAPIVWLVMRQARLARQIPTDHEHNQIVERARAAAHLRGPGSSWRSR